LATAARRFAVAERIRGDESPHRALAKNLARVEGKIFFQLAARIDSPEWKEHISAIFDGDEKQIAYAERVIAHPADGHDSVHGG